MPTTLDAKYREHNPNPHHRTRKSREQLPEGNIPALEYSFFFAIVSFFMDLLLFHNYYNNRIMPKCLCIWSISPFWNHVSIYF